MTTILEPMSGCPIYHGHETRMLKESFIRQCLIYQKHVPAKNTKFPWADMYGRCCADCETGQKVSKGEWFDPPVNMAWIDPRELLEAGGAVHKQLQVRPALLMAVVNRPLAPSPADELPEQLKEEEEMGDIKREGILVEEKQAAGADRKPFVWKKEWDELWIPIPDEVVVTITIPGLRDYWKAEVLRGVKRQECPCCRRMQLNHGNGLCGACGASKYRHMRGTELLDAMQQLSSRLRGKPIRAQRNNNMHMAICKKKVQGVVVPSSQAPKEKEPDEVGSGQGVFLVMLGYEALAAILQEALNQAQLGKGKERHAAEAEPFSKQKICEITRRVGLGFPVGQAVKKVEEALRLGGDAGCREMLGAINYICAAVICSREGGVL